MQTGSSDPKVGRTGWDVLASSKLFFIFLLVAVGIVAFCYFSSDSLSEIAVSFDKFLNDNKYYLLSIVAGALLAKYVYEHYIISPVVVFVDNPELDIACWRFSRSYFAKITKANDALNPLATSYGEPFYYAKSYDPLKHEIDLGYIHSRDVSPSWIYSVRENYYTFLKSLHESQVRSVLLEDAPFTEGVDISRKVIKSHLEKLSRILGIDDSIQTQSEQQLKVDDNQ